MQCGLSFHVASTPAWKNAIRAASRIDCDWEGPSMRDLRTIELQRMRDSVELRMEPLRETWQKYGCSILCDGWTDVRKRNVYNILVHSCKGTMFLRAIDASAPGTVVSGAFIYEHIRQAIIDVGVQSVVQVVTDNGSNCVAMGQMVETEFPSIVWTPCAAHCLDLLLRLVD